MFSDDPEVHRAEKALGAARHRAAKGRGGRTMSGRDRLRMRVPSDRGRERDRNRHRLRGARRGPRFADAAAEHVGTVIVTSRSPQTGAPGRRPHSKGWVPVLKVSPRPASPRK